jgi:ribonucleotide reductase alpha subunit
MGSEAIQVSKGLLPTPPIPEDLPPVALTENARQVLVRRYVRRGDTGQPVESPEEMFWRVAFHIARAEEAWGGDVMQTARNFYVLLTSKKFFPNSPTFTGAGTMLGQLAACFVLPINDDMGRDTAGIFQSLRDAALIQQTGGGNGFSFSRLRPHGALVKSSAGQATGPVGFLRVYDHAFGEVAQGGCLVPDTLVFTGDGLLRMDEIVDRDTLGWQAHRLPVATDEGWRESTRAFNNGVARVLRVRTLAGLCLTGTPEHRVKVMTNTGPSWRMLRELRPGDWLLVQLGQYRGRLRGLRLPPPGAEATSPVHLPAVLEEDLAFLLGILAGLGHEASLHAASGIGLSLRPDSYLLHELPKVLERLFGIEVRFEQPSGRVVRLVVDQPVVREFLLLNGWENPGKITTHVPRLVRQSPPEVAAAYLRGIFEAAGAVSQGVPELAAASGRLIDEVGTMMIGLGCPVHLQGLGREPVESSSQPFYRVRLERAEDLRAWKENIGCDPRSRFAQLQSPDAAAGPENNTLQATVGAQTAFHDEALQRAKVMRPGTQAFLREYGSDGPRPLQLVRRQAAGGTLQAGASGHGRWFVQVQDITAQPESLTLDLEVTGNHTYLAQGLVTHNTRRGANMGVLRVDHPDIEDFISCKTNENQITNFNISVGITDAFMKAVKEDGDWDLVFPDVTDPAYRGFNGTLDQARQAGIPIRVHKTVRARELYQSIARQAHHNGEPGVLFLDTANRSNPVPHLYPLESTNPCVTGETPVATPRGWRRADSLRPGDEICTVLGVGRVASVEVNENMPVYTLRLSDGSMVRATGSHQFQVRLGEGGVFEPRRLDQLKLGDELRIHRAALSKACDLPGAALSEERERGFLAGFLASGGISRPAGRPGVDQQAGTGPAEEQDQLRVSAASFQAEPGPRHGSARSRSEFPAVQVSSSSWRRLLQGELQESRVFLAAFLDGLFSAAGEVDLPGPDPAIRCRVPSSELAQQVRRILLMFSIHARLAPCRTLDPSKGEKGSESLAGYEITIRGEGFESFFDQVPLSHPGKQMRIEEAVLKNACSGEEWTAQVTAIEPAGRATVYDLYEPRSDSWITDGLVSRGCGEQWLGPYENCCLGSINLNEHCGVGESVDWEGLRRSVQLATRFLDDVVDVNAYVPAVPQLKEAAQRARRIGLGVMGLADLMYHVGVRYGTLEGQEFGSQVMEFIRHVAMLTSIELARERGAFPAISGSIYDFEDMRWRPPEPLVPYTRSWGRPIVDWGEVMAGIQKYGIRNAAQTTVAPTGTIATVAGCEGYGCEPVFGLAYTRHMNDQGKDLQLTYASPRFDIAMERAGISGEARSEIVEKVMQHGTCQDIPEVPETLRRVFVVAGDISADEHVRMQAALQAFVDNSLSKTINFPAGASVDDVARAYMLAWELGCKGITVYVTGSREKVVLETKAVVRKKQPAPPAENPVVLPFGSRTAPQPVSEAELATQLAAWHESKKPRPRLLAGKTFRIETPLGKAFVTVNENGGRQPFEVFINTAKAGSETAAVSEAIGRLISYVLRLASPITPRERLAEVVRQLSGIGGGRSLGFGPNRVRSLPDGVSQALDEYLTGKSIHVLTEGDPAPEAGTPDALLFVPGAATPENPPTMGDLCPECGEATMINEEGCRKCYTCGYSEC